MVLGQTVSIPIKVSNNLGNSQMMYVGIAPSATDGVDGALGEAVLPPLPPKEIFDARFKFPTTNNDYSTIDYRYGTKPPFSSTITYYLEVQPGLGTSVTIEWELPKETSGVIKDKFGGIVVNKSMSGKGSLIVTNLAINKLDITINYNLITSANSRKTIPNSSELFQNYPNPFNPETTISYKIQAASHVRLAIYDALGREIKTLVDEFKQPGIYNSTFSTLRSSLSSGVYFCKLLVDNLYSIKKMIITK